jgi:hypothetical protein
MKSRIVGAGIFVVFSFIAATLWSGRGLEGARDALAIIIVPAALLVVVLLLPRIGYFMSYWHEAELLRFIKDTLAATEPHAEGATAR